MATEEEILRTKTFKENGMEVGRRVFYTIHDEGSKDWKTQKAVALLIEALHTKNILSDEQLDELLLSVVHS
jgi:hypothetical protein